MVVKHALALWLSPTPTAAPIHLALLTAGVESAKKQPPTPTPVLQRSRLTSISSLHKWALHVKKFTSPLSVAFSDSRHRHATTCLKAGPDQSFQAQRLETCNRMIQQRLCHRTVHTEAPGLRPHVNHIVSTALGSQRGFLELFFTAQHTTKPTRTLNPPCLQISVISSTVSSHFFDSDCDIALALLAIIQSHTKPHFVSIASELLL